jgi:uncharacterized membrane protein YkoI
MNTKNLSMNQKMLAIIIGVAIIATAGVTAASAQVAGSTTQGTTTQQPPQIQGSINLQQNLLSNVQTKFSDAANTAQSSVPNGKVIGGSLTVMQGYVVYAFKVIDDKNLAYSVIIDPANGKVLYTSPGHQVNFGGMFGMGHSGMKHGFHQRGQAPNSQQTPGSTIAPSGTVGPSSGSTNSGLHS